MAVTVINTLYPPLIETFQPAFVYNTNVPIVFSLSPFNAVKDIVSVHVSVVDQRNNSNVLQSYIAPTWQKDLETNTNTQYKYSIFNNILIAELPSFESVDGIQQQGIFQYDSTNNLYAINLFPEWLNKTGEYWNNNQYYQIQIRFDSCPSSEWKTSNDGTYMLEKREYFSEWSSVTLVKPILEPVLSITQLDKNKTKMTYPGIFHISGYIVFDEVKDNGITLPETEQLQSYRIIVTSDNEEWENVNTGWIYAKSNLLKTEKTAIDYLLDLTNAQNGDNLKITITCRTNNGYVFDSDYDIVIQEYGNPILTEVSWNNSLTDTEIIEVNQEDGIANINFSAKCAGTAILYFKRACSKDNFKKWEIIYRYNNDIVQDETKLISFSFKDFTIGSLYEYQYSVQACHINTNNNEQWGKIYWSKKIYPKFYEMLLMRQNKQIAIRYNGQVSSWKPTVNRQKIDTLGGRYPKFVENAVMNYKTYQISGLISAEGDFNRKFLNEADDSNNVQRYDREFGEQYLIRNDTAADGEIEYDDNRNQQIRKNQKVGKELYTKNNFSGELNNQHDTYPHNHWYWEREFREALVNWLNDGEPKLYRSMPEGNIAVMLTDINLTPDSQLSRMLYNFSATMYEVGNGYSLEELDNLGIINIPVENDIFLTASNFRNMTMAEDKDENLTAPAFGQITLSSSMNGSNWINGTMDNHNTMSLWNSMSIKEKLDEYYQSSNVEVANGSIRLNNITLQFITSPHYFAQNEEGKFVLSKDEATNWLGYVINITEKGQNIGKQVFINQKGYYHIPDSIDIVNIEILGASDIIQKAEIFYEYQYKLSPSSKADPDINQLGDVIGQFIRDKMPLDINIISLIKQDHEKIEYKNGEVAIDTHLNTCKGLMLDVTPYTYITYRHVKETVETNNTLVVGGTGVFDSFEDWPLEDLQIKGRRMIVINPNDILGNGVDTEDQITPYPYHIEEWQCYNDIKNNDINNPKINGIYTKDGIKQIYYIDGRWYPIDESLSDNTVIIAKVPIYGMINYHGDLVEVIY